MGSAFLVKKKPTKQYKTLNIMITLIILIALTAIGIWLFDKDDDDWQVVVGIIMFLVFGLWAIIHILCLSFVSYDYGLFVEKRNAFEQTLITSRANGREYETAAIVKEVAQWNVKLASLKYRNKNFYHSQFIDDRIESLKPIE